MLDKEAKIFVAGHRGMVGSAIVRQLVSVGYENILTATRNQLDLLSQQSVRDFMHSQKPDYIVLSAAKVGGIHANNEYPAEFIYENLMIEANVVHEAYNAGVNQLLFLGSSCIYPKMAKQPMTEDELLTGVLEPTNEPYAIAKIAGIKLCESYNRQYGTDFRSVMPTNLYGPNDNFNLENSHVIPALIRKFYDAKVSGATQVEVWGSGNAMREFLHVDDMALACVHVMNLDKEVYEAVSKPMLSHINVGTGVDVTIKELANYIAGVTQFKGAIVFDSSKPDGTPRKLLDVSKLKKLGWSPHYGLEEGLQQAYSWFLDNISEFRQ